MSRDIEDHQTDRDTAWLLKVIAEHDRRYQDRFMAQEHALRLARETLMTRATGYAVSGLSIIMSLVSLVVSLSKFH